MIFNIFDDLVGQVLCLYLFSVNVIFELVFQLDLEKEKNKEKYFKFFFLELNIRMFFRYVFL